MFPLFPGPWTYRTRPASTPETERPYYCTGPQSFDLQGEAPVEDINLISDNDYHY
jgi:hypothetical protein